MNFFFKMVVIIALARIDSGIRLLAERYDDTKLLAARITAAENDIREFRGQINTIGTLGLQNMDEAKNLIEEVKDVHQRKASSKKTINARTRNKNRKSSPEIQEKGTPENP